MVALKSVSPARCHRQRSPSPPSALPSWRGRRTDPSSGRNRGSSLAPIGGGCGVVYAASMRNETSNPIQSHLMHTWRSVSASLSRVCLCHKVGQIVSVQRSDAVLTRSDGIVGRHSLASHTLAIIHKCIDGQRSTISTAALSTCARLSSSATLCNTKHHQASSNPKTFHSCCLSTSTSNP